MTTEKNGYCSNYQLYFFFHEKLLVAVFHAKLNPIFDQVCS